MYALPGFTLAFAKGRHPKFYRITTANDIFIASIVIGTLRLGPFPVFRYSTGFALPQPLIRGGHERSEAWNALDQLGEVAARQLHCASTIIHVYPQDHQVLGPQAGPSTWDLRAGGTDLMLPLSEGLQKIYDGLEKRHRYTLRRSAGLEDEDIVRFSPKILDKCGGVFRDGIEFPFIDQFYELWMVTVEKMRRQLDALELRGVEEGFRREIYRKSINQLVTRGLARVFLLCRGGKAIAGAVVHLSSGHTAVNQAYWSAGAATYEAKKEGLPLLLQWLIIGWLSRNEYAEYYLGGTEDKSSGPTLFKLGFGAIPVSGKLILKQESVLKAAEHLYPITLEKSRIAKTLLGAAIRGI